MLLVRMETTDCLTMSVPESQELRRPSLAITIITPATPTNHYRYSDTCVNNDKTMLPCWILDILNKEWFIESNYNFIFNKSSFIL